MTCVQPGAPPSETVRDAAVPGSTAVKGAAGKVAWGAVLQGVAVLAYGAATVLIARALTPSMFGMLAVGTAIAFIGGDALDLGRSKALVQLQARGGTETRQLAHRLILIKLLCSPAILVVLTVASLVIGHRIHASMLLFWVYAMFFTTWQTLITPLRARAELRLISSCAAQERVVALAVIAVTLGWLGAASLPVGLAVGAATVCLRLARPGWAYGDGRMTMRQLTRMARPLAVVSLTSDAQMVDVPMVAAIAGPVPAGIFAAASRLLGPLNLVATQVAVLVFARASEPEQRFTRRHAIVMVCLVALLYGPVLVLLWWQSGAIVRILLGDQFAASADVLRILTVGVALMIVVAPLVSWMQARGRARMVATAFSVSLTVYLSILLFGAIRGSMSVLSLAYPVLHGTTLLLLLGNILARRTRSSAAGR